MEDSSKYIGASDTKIEHSSREQDYEEIESLEPSTDEEIEDIDASLLDERTRIADMKGEAENTKRRLQEVRKDLDIPPADENPPGLSASFESIEQAEVNVRELTNKKSSLLKKTLAFAGLAGSLLIDSDSAHAINTEAPAPPDHTTVTENGKSNLDDPHKMLTETGTWAPLLVNEISKEQQAVSDGKSAMAFVRDSYSKFVKEMNNPPQGSSAPYSKTVWGRIGTAEDWRSMAKSCGDLVRIYETTVEKFNVDKSNIADEVDYLSSYSRGFKEKAERLDGDTEQASHPILKKSVRNETANNSELTRALYMNEKRLIVHGFIEVPDKRHGGVVSDSFKESNGTSVSLKT